MTFHLSAIALDRNFKRSSYDLLRGLMAACEAVEVILWDFPDDEAKNKKSWDHKAFWRNFEIGSAVWKRFRLGIRDLQPGVFQGIQPNPMDIHLADSVFWTRLGRGAHDNLALEFGPWLLLALVDRTFRLDRYPYVHHLGVIINGWLGCRCGCDSYPAIDRQSVIDSVVRTALDHLAANTTLSWIGDLPGPSVEKKLRIAFKEKKVYLGRRSPCAAYKAHQTRILEEHR